MLSETGTIELLRSSVTDKIVGLDGAEEQWTKSLAMKSLNSREWLVAIPTVFAAFALVGSSYFHEWGPKNVSIESRYGDVLYDPYGFHEAKETADITAKTVNTIEVRSLRREHNSFLQSWDR